MQLYDTARRAVVPLQTLVPNQVSIYTCGPTVYWNAHIGNLRCYIAEDVLVRTLRFLGYSVTRVMNITDVGHLQSDADDGEDRLEVGAKRDGITAWEVAKRYEQQFVTDFAEVGNEQPDRLVRATDTIAEQIQMVQALESAGHTYTIADGVYFDSTTFTSYGEMARLNLEGQQAGARVEQVAGKRHPSDFALWKRSPSGSTRDMEWDSPWGVGFPGWHIECSAIARKELGDQLDIHCGGVDHIPIHHTNEIAQTESLTHKQLAGLWMHVEFLQVDGGKMSKSLGNGYTLEDLRAHGVSPLAFRYFCLQAQYRTKQNFTWEAVQGAEVAWSRMRLQALRLPEGVSATSEQLQPFLAALEDDLNTPKALGLLWDALANPQPWLRDAIAQVDSILNLGLLTAPEVVSVPDDVRQLAEQRWQAKQAKDWAAADALRGQIAELGWEMLDGAESYHLQPR